MPKKDFKNANTSRVYGAIQDATAQDVQEAPERKERRTYDSVETKEALDTMATQGKKGIKLSRINMAFSPEVHSYIKIMSQVRGQTITDFVNDILMQSLEANRETYEKAQEFIKGLKSL